MFIRGFKKCCCCVNLLTAAKIVAILGLLPCVLILVYVTYYSAYNPTFKRSPWTQTDIIAMTWFSLLVISNSCLLYGASRFKKLYILPWLFVQVLVMAFQTYVVVSIVYKTRIHILLSPLILVGVELYVWVAMLSLFLAMPSSSLNQTLPEESEQRMHLESV
ncbi:hypothetical protein TCAL_15556 [Tigriopus californicus]|uniref:DUF7027 domain-containing protein n=1 Tax=Tigriopus californicus TaxID=6832 RepID=A0A553PAH1_TIGCA|nr:hypothetical protein TCAL_15556 [Tigriopus californicus]